MLFQNSQLPRISFKDIPGIRVYFFLSIFPFFSRFFFYIFLFFVFFLFQNAKGDPSPPAENAPVRLYAELQFNSTWR